MKNYVKFRSFGCTRLIDIYDEESQKEAMEDGYNLVLKKDGTPDIITSDELISGKSKSEMSDILNVIKERSLRIGV